MTIRERLQALLDGRPFLCSDGMIRRVKENHVQVLHSNGTWAHSSSPDLILSIECALYEEPKPEPTAHQKRKEFRHKYFSACLAVEQADAIADYIDERLKELGK